MGSSNRCTSKKGLWRCNRDKGHDGSHQAKTGKVTTYWT